MSDTFFTSDGFRPATSPRIVIPAFAGMTMGVGREEDKGLQGTTGLTPGVLHAKKLGIWMPSSYWRPRHHGVVVAALGLLGWAEYI